MIDRGGHVSVIDDHRPLWLLAPVLLTLLRELDIGWPLRSRLHDGTIGDAAHQARKSDHNPDQNGYVRAIDVTQDVHNGPPMDLLAEFLRKVGETHSQRVTPQGYVIWQRRIASSRSRWKWVTYMGENPHTDHLHLSCSSRPDFYRLTAPWHVYAAIAARAL